MRRCPSCGWPHNSKHTDDVPRLIGVVMDPYDQTELQCRCCGLIAEMWRWDNVDRGFEWLVEEDFDG